MSESILRKQPGESRIYTINFAQNMERNESITSILELSFTPEGLVVSSAANAIYAGQIIQFRVSGGVDKESYEITARVGTSLGNILECDVMMMVRESV